jgi:hypothetical protein
MIFRKTQGDIYILSNLCALCFFGLYLVRSILRLTREEEKLIYNIV